MGRVTKKTPETPKAVEESPAQTVTQTRAKRTPKPNPKYANDSVIIPPKIESSESNGSTDIEDKLPETKIVKSTKKVISKIEESATKVRAVQKAKTAVVVKKQKIEFDDDEKTKDADEIPLNPSPPPTTTTTRATRSGKVDLTKDEKGEIKVGEESVAIIDVSSIIAKGPAITKQESPKTPIRGSARKRQAQEVIEIKEDSPKKKKEEDKPSLITARKSYISPSSANKKDEEIVEEEGEEEVKPEVVEKNEVTTQKKEVVTDVKTPASTMKTRRNATTPQSAEPAEKKTKVEDVKPEPAAVSKSATAIIEPKKLPVLRKEQITKVSPVATLPNAKTTVNNVMADNVNTPVSKEPKPAPRLLNSMITPKSAKMSPNVKLAGDGSDKKVFSIDLSFFNSADEAEKKQGLQQQKTAATVVPKVTSPVKTQTPTTVAKENVAVVTKPQPSVLLKNKLESELNRMKASANLMKRQMLTTPQARHSAGSHSNVTQSGGARRITKFESWYVIDVKNQDPITPHKHHVHTYSLIRLGNKLKEIQLPSSKWDYKVTLQRRQQKKQQQNNNNEDDGEDEFYTGDVHDKAIEAEKHNFEPSSILFKRSFRDSNKITIDRSVMIKPNVYNITMNGKPCHLVGAPDDIKSIEDLEILLKIIDSSSMTHPCIEIAS